MSDNSFVGKLGDSKPIAAKHRDDSGDWREKVTAKKNEKSKDTGGWEL